MEQQPEAVDVSRKYVRLVERRADGLVEFEFSISDPSLYVEMLLPAPAYEEFCLAHQVIQLDSPRPEAAEEWGWNLHDARTQRFR